MKNLEKFSILFNSVLFAGLISEFRNARLYCTDSSSSDEKIDDEKEQMPRPVSLTNKYQTSPQVSSSGAVTVSSHEEDNEEEGERKIFALEEKNSDTSNSNVSADENAGLAVEQDLGVLQKKALRNAFFSINLKHKQGSVLLKTLRAFPFNGLPPLATVKKSIFFIAFFLSISI